MRPAAAWRNSLVVVVLTLAVAACGPKVSRQSFDKIADGMKEAEVQAILGVASESRSSAMKVEDTVYTSTQSKWRTDKGTIVVLFLNGEVQQKIFYEPGEEPPPERRG